MGVSIDRSLKYQRSLLGQVKEIFYLAEIYCYSYKQILDMRVERVFKSPYWSKSPNWVRCYINGYFDCKLESLWQKMVFSYELEGKRYIVGTPEYRAIEPQRFCEVSDTGAHMWAKDTSKFFTLPDKQ